MAVLLNGLRHHGEYRQTLATELASIKTPYVDASGNKIGDLVSESIHLQVAESASLALLGIGLFGLGFSRRRF